MWYHVNTLLVILLGCLLTVLKSRWISDSKSRIVVPKIKGNNYFIGSDEKGNPKSNLMVETMTISSPIGSTPVMIRCRKFGGTKVISALQRIISERNMTVRQLNGKQMSRLVKKCNSLQLKLMTRRRRQGNDSESATPRSPWGGLAIYPGTKWCGAGNISANYDDLGIQRATDMCCREHDLCPDYIEAGESKYGLRNPGHYTLSHCDCDWKFGRCLRTADTLASNEVGISFFNLMQSRCFREDYPIISCKRYMGIDLSKSCQEYRLHTNKSKEWQFFDAQFYTGVPMLPLNIRSKSSPLIKG